jgi:hypothetical protein
MKELYARLRRASCVRVLHCGGRVPVMRFVSRSILVSPVRVDQAAGRVPAGAEQYNQLRKGACWGRTAQSVEEGCLLGQNGTIS